MGTPIEGGEVQGTDGGAVENSPGPNPAWDEVLGVIPESLHSAVTPHFQKWDQSAQQRIEQANTQLKAFESYQPFVDNQISPEDLEQGLQLMYQLNTNPQGVYEALAQAYGYGAQSPTSQEGGTGAEGEGEGEGNEFQDPRFDQLQQGLDLVAQTILTQQQREMEAQASAQIDAEVEQMKQQHPGISEEFIYSLMVNGFDASYIGNKWNEVTQNILQQNPRPFAPSVLGSNGGGTGLPSQAIDPTKLNGKDTRNLVVQMLNAANRT